MVLGRFGWFWVVPGFSNYYVQGRWTKERKILGGG